MEEAVHVVDLMLVFIGWLFDFRVFIDGLLDFVVGLFSLMLSRFVGVWCFVLDRFGFDVLGCMMFGSVMLWGSVMCNRRFFLFLFGVLNHMLDGML